MIFSLILKKQAKLPPLNWATRRDAAVRQTITMRQKGYQMEKLEFPTPIAPVDHMKRPTSISAVRREYQWPI